MAYFRKYAAAQLDRAATATFFARPVWALQRKCACGGNGSKDEECDECKKKGGAILQRRSLSRLYADDESTHSQQLPRVTEETEELGMGGLAAAVTAPSTSSISASPPAQESGLTLNPPNDQYEQEADRMSQQIADASDGVTHTLIAPKLRIQRLASVLDSCPPLQNTSRAEEHPTSPRITPPLTARVGAEIRRAEGSGEPLTVSEREFFEPRFGHDFSKVRIHSGAQAASLANAVDASAFTVGHNIFFNTGHYQPSSPLGRSLLAHELTHVVQQGEAEGAPVALQRAKIPYTNLVWGDFKGKVPAKSKFAAETSTGLGTFQHTVPKTEVEDTENPCKLGNKNATEFTATVSIDPDAFDGVSPFMTQEKSWVRDRYRDEGHAHCVGVVKDCEVFFAKEAAKAKKLCLKQVATCKKDFKKGAASLTFTINEKPIRVTRESECATTLLQDCQEFALQNNPFTLHEDKQPAFLKVDSKKDCKTQAFDQCVPHEKEESERILKHEQGHFDITKVMAENLQSELKTKAAELTAEATKCGKQQAIDAALKAFNAGKPWQVLDQIVKDRTKKWNEAQDAYDKETDHGLKQDVQTSWEGDISDGLKKFLSRPEKPSEKKKKGAHKP